jgi:hypothetical protein
LQKYKKLINNGKRFVNPIKDVLAAADFQLKEFIINFIIKIEE